MSFKSEIVFSYFFQVANVILGFLSTIFLTKLLTQDDWGNYSLFQNLILMTSIIGGLSLSSATVYFVASSKIDKFKLLYNFVLFQLVLSALIVVGFIFINNYIFKDAIKLNIHKFYLIFFLQLSCVMINNIVVGVMRGEFMFNKINVIVFISNFMLFSLLGIFYFLEPFRITINFIFSIIIGSSLFQLLISLYFFFKIQDKVSFRFSLLKRAEIKTIYKFVLYVYVANVLQVFVYKVDTWILYKYFDSATTGVYALAVTVSQTTWLFATAVSTILFSVASKETFEVSKNILKTYIRLSLLVSICLGTALMVFLFFFIDHVFGKQYAEILRIIPILLLGIIPFSINIIFASFVAGLNKNRINLIGSSISFVTVVVFDFILIPHFSYWGASMATVLSYLASTVFSIIMMKNVFNVKLNSVFSIEGFASDIQKGYKFVTLKLKKKEHI